jgi:hypothetical protein
MTFNHEQQDINQLGRNLLTLIRASGQNGITSKGLTDALKSQLDKQDYAQLDALEAEGFIVVEQVDIIDHPDVERLYRAVTSRA